MALCISFALISFLSFFLVHCQSDFGQISVTREEIDYAFKGQYLVLPIEVAGVNQKELNDHPERNLDLAVNELFSYVLEQSYTGSPEVLNRMTGQEDYFKNPMVFNMTFALAALYDQHLVVPYSKLMIEADKSIKIPLADVFKAEIPEGETSLPIPEHLIDLLLMSEGPSLYTGPGYPIIKLKPVFHGAAIEVPSSAFKNDNGKAYVNVSNLLKMVGEEVVKVPEQLLNGITYNLGGFYEPLAVSINEMLGGCTEPTLDLDSADLSEGKNDTTLVLLANLIKGCYAVNERRVEVSQAMVEKILKASPYQINYKQHEEQEAEQHGHDENPNSILNKDPVETLLEMSKNCPNITLSMEGVITHFMQDISCVGKAVIDEILTRYGSHDASMDQDTQTKHNKINELLKELQALLMEAF